MSTNPRSALPTNEAGSTLARIYWMALGNLLLVAGALTVLTSEPGLGLADLLFALAALSLIGVRWLDITRFDGRTADGDPATPKHLHRYAVGVALVSALVWAVAHLASSWV